MGVKNDKLPSLSFRNFDSEPRIEDDERERVNDFHLNYSKNSVEQNSRGAPAPISSDAQETHFIA